jgi:hypothetical protein
VHENKTRNISRMQRSRLNAKSLWYALEQLLDFYFVNKSSEEVVFREERHKVLSIFTAFLRGGNKYVSSSANTFWLGNI